MSAILDEIDAYVAANRHTDRSFVRAVLDGKASAAGLRRWSIQKYLQVYDQNRNFSAIHSYAAQEDVRQFMMEQLIAEETAITSGSAPHYELMARFALAMGATRDDLASAKPAPAVRRFVDFLMRTARTGLFLDGLLPIYCNESQTYGAADHLYRYLKDQYALGERELEWFAEHGTADKGHANRGREILAKYLPHYPEFGRRALDLAKESVVEWLALHEYYYSVL